MKSSNIQTVISTVVEKSFPMVNRISRLSLAVSGKAKKHTKLKDWLSAAGYLHLKSGAGKVQKVFTLLIFSSFIFTNLFAQTQNSDNLYKKPLADVLKDIQTRFKVQIKYSEPQVKDKWVNYADWRFRTDVDKTLANVLTPLDMKVNKEKPGVYKLKEYEYYRWEVQDGWAYLDTLATKYHDKASWEKRKAEIKPELYQALMLSPLPAKPNSRPIITAKRVFDGYSVENIALEILPGVWINGSLYKPLNVKGKIPVVLSPDGHW